LGITFTWHGHAIVGLDVAANLVLSAGGPFTL
jgi:hypothetical protein